MKSLVRESVQELAAYVPGEQPGDSDIIKLNTNENPYPPAPAVMDALSAFSADRSRMYPDPVSAEVRSRIATLHGCDLSRIFAGNGSDEVLALCTRAFVDDGGCIGYFEPSYSLYPVLADIRGARKQPVELGPDFEWRMPEDYCCSLFFLTNPNAPTGMLHPKEEVRAFCTGFPGVVVIDEAYVDFAAENCLDLALELDNVLCCRSFSKSYSMAGFRVGYAVGPVALVSALFKIKDSYNLNALSQAAAAAALAGFDHMRANVARIKATRQRLADALSGMGHTVYPSETNFVWVRPAGMKAGELFERLRDEGILVRHFAGNRTRDHVRITVGTDEEIDTLLSAVAGLTGN